jgi:hypothetical protein
VNACAKRFASGVAAGNRDVLHVLGVTHGDRARVRLDREREHGRRGGSVVRRRAG